MFQGLRVLDLHAAIPQRHPQCDVRCRRQRGPVSEGVAERDLQCDPGVHVVVGTVLVIRVRSVLDDAPGYLQRLRERHSDGTGPWRARVCDSRGEWEERGAATMLRRGRPSTPQPNFTLHHDLVPSIGVQASRLSLFWYAYAVMLRLWLAGRGK